MSRRSRLHVRLVAAGSGLLAITLGVSLLAGCATRADVAQQAGDYLSPDGRVSQIAEKNRSDPIVFDGTDELDNPVSSEDFLGTVLVVNFWYASCPPCRMEAPWLQELSEEFADDDVQFLGVNVRDEPPQARSFAEKFGVTYPSIIDHDASVVLAFAGIASPRAVPTTVILDREGRFAARIVGIIEKSVLDGLITATLEDSVL